MNKTLLNSLTCIALVAFVYYLIPGFPHLFVYLVGGQWTDAALCLILFLALVQMQPEKPKQCPKCGYDLQSKHSTQPLETGIRRIK